MLKEKLSNFPAIVYLYDLVFETRLKYFTNQKKRTINRFKKRTQRDLDLENPLFFNDKLQWLKFNWYNPLATKCADKYYVRDYIKNTIGEEYLNELIGVYDKIEDIDLDLLPDKFVIKATHSSGEYIICTDKKKLNWKKAKRNMKRWLRRNYYYKNMEWVYKDIKPRIIIEKYLGSNENNELMDYRFYCFNGKPEYIIVDISITDKEQTRRNIYTLDWEKLDARMSYPNENKIEINKPKNLNTMITLSKQLSEPFPFSRVDFYNVNEKIIFGEITFFPQSGMSQISPKEFELELGEKLILPKKS